MRTSSFSTRARSGASRPRPRPGRPRSSACLAFAALIACGVLAAPASAKTSPPLYVLRVTEGETTLPEFQIVQTSASAEPSASVVVSIARNGTVIARSSGNGYTGTSQVPQVGDVLTMESPAGTPVGAVVYDGLPSMDPTVCAGSANFSGQNSPGETVKGSFVTLTPRVERYGTSVQESNFGRAQVTILSGSTFGGSFLAPLAIGQTVTATESLETPLAGGAVFKYISENSRPVGACPVVVAPAPPPPPPLALQGTILKFLRTTIHHLLAHGWRNRVTINQPGTVTQDLYLKGGKLPAFAATSTGGHHHRTPPALLLARGSTTAGHAGTVSVLLKPTAKGRRRLKSATNVTVVLVTTLRSRSGTKLNLTRHTVTLHR